MTPFNRARIRDAADLIDKAMTRLDAVYNSGTEADRADIELSMERLIQALTALRNMED